MVVNQLIYDIWAGSLQIFMTFESADVLNFDANSCTVLFLFSLICDQHSYFAHYFWVFYLNELFEWRGYRDVQTLSALGGASYKFVSLSPLGNIGIRTGWRKIKRLSINIFFVMKAPALLMSSHSLWEKRALSPPNIGYGGGVIGN